MYPKSIQTANIQNLFKYKIFFSHFSRTYPRAPALATPFRRCYGGVLMSVNTQHHSTALTAHYPPKS